MVFKLLVVVAVLLNLSSAQFPSYIKKCSRTSTEINNCLKENMEATKPFLKDGIPELEIPPTRTLPIPELVLKKDKFFLDVDQLDMHHLDTFEVEDIKFDMKGAKLDIILKFPLLSGEGHYTMSGTFFGTTFNGTGRSEGNMTELVIGLHMEGEHKKVNDKDFIDFEISKVDLKSAGPSVYFFHELVKNDEALNSKVNQVINDHMAEFVDEIKPIIEECLLDLVQPFIKKFFDKYSVDDLFLP